MLTCFSSQPVSCPQETCREVEEAASLGGRTVDRQAKPAESVITLRKVTNGFYNTLNNGRCYLIHWCSFQSAVS